MRFVIQGLKYDTDKMKKIANVKKWYKTNSLLVKAIYGNEEVGTTYDCELWRSEKGNWLLTHTEDYNTKVGHAITEEEAKSLLMRYAPDIYETEFEKNTGSIEKANPYCKGGDLKQWGLELNKESIAQYIVFVNVVFLYIGRNRIGKVGFTWL